jgi:xanthine dehydrogenase FAD-binding subunit
VRLSEIRVVTARTAAEALRYLQEYGSDARLIAGGTDAVVEMKEKVRLPKVWVDISRVDELRFIGTAGEQLTVGALSTYTDILRSPLLREKAPLLVEACAYVGAVQIRNAGTIGGNLGTASPAGDSLPPLYALEADVTLLGPGGERRVPVEEFFVGVRRTVRRPDELIAAVSFLPQPAGERSLFQKLGPRHSQAISIVNLAIRLRLEPDRSLSFARFAYGAVAPTILRARKCETAALVAGPLDDARARAIAQLAWKEVAPITDIRGTAEYRREMAVSLMLRGLLTFAGKEVGLSAGAD